MSTPDAQHAAALVAEALDVLADADGLEETIRTRDSGGQILVGGLPVGEQEAAELVREQRGAALLSLASAAAINLQRIADALDAGGRRAGVESIGTMELLGEAYTRAAALAEREARDR